MQPPPELIDLIRRFEGLRLKAYLCPAGIWTCGWGSTGPDVKPGLVWDRDTADARMLLDATRFTNAARQLCPSLDGAQLAAVADFAYNLGATRLASSTLRRKINRGDPFAADEFDKWVWGGGRKLPGLVARRAAEKALFLSKPSPDDDPTP